MVSLILLGVILTLVFYKIFKYVFGKPENFPPGPPRIPFFGSYLFMLMINKRHLHKAAAKLSEYYKSNMIGLYLSDFPTIIVNDYEISKEVLNRKDFDGRPDLFLGRLRDPERNRRGIFFTDGPNWVEQRRFTLRHLRDFGFGRRFPELEFEAQHEIENLIDLLQYGPKYEHEKVLMKDGYACCPNILSACFANIFLHIMCGERIPRADQERLIKAGMNALSFQRHGDDYGTILSIVPSFHYLFPDKSGYNTIKKASDVVYKFIESIVITFMDSHDENHSRNFVDLYIKEMGQREAKNGDEFTFQYDQLIMGLADFYFPAASGVTAQLSLLFQHILLKPELLEKMQQEIDEVVGHGRLPSLDDRINLPYTEATLRETMRIETLVPSGIAHKALFDTTLRGYDVKKGTLLFLTLDYMHKQESVWGDPQNFRPERFLDENGKLCLKKDKSLPFGAGKRLCAGETFARNSMFLVMSALAQNFNMEMKDKAVSDMSENTTGIIYSPLDFWVKFVPR